MNDPTKSIILPEKMLINSKFNINKDSINLESVELLSKTIHTNINGKILDYLGKTKTSFNINIRVNRAKVEDIIKILPAFKIEELDAHKLKKYKLYGDLLANFSIKGRLPEPDIIGDIYLNNIILNRPIPKTTKGASIKLILKGKDILFDANVPAGDLEKVRVEGKQEIYNIKYADFTVKSSDAVNLKTAQNVIEPLHEILNFTIGPVPIMDINGIGNINISVKGNRKNPHIFGGFNLKNGRIWLKDMPDLKLENTNASLKFNDQNVSFTADEGKINNQDFKLQGICDLFGKFDFNLSSENQPTESLYNAIKSSTMIPEISKILPQLKLVKGYTDLNLKIYGSYLETKPIKFNKNLFAKGNINFNNNSIVSQNIQFDKISGFINFDNLDFDSEISSLVGELPLYIKSKVKNEIANINLNIPKLNPNLLITDSQTRNKQYLPYISVIGKYNGSIKNIDYTKLNLQAKILSSIPTSKIKYEKNGEINIINNKIYIKNVKGFINNNQNTFKIDLLVNDAFSNKLDANGSINIKTPDLSLFNEILTSDLIPETARKYTQNIEFKKGALNLNAKISNNKINAFTDIAGITFIYTPLEIPIEIINGSLGVRNNTLKLNKINLLADNMPILVDGDIKDIFDKQNFNLYLNSKPQQDFIDKYINKNQIYPIKIKGDIVYWVKLKGIPSSFDLKAQIDMSKDSSIYHFGATIGDIENAIMVYIDTKITDNMNHWIKDFTYDKIVESQSGRQTRLNMLRAWGGVSILKDDLAFNNLRIKTSHPTDARIFNIIFRKPNIKQGQFTSDLKFNGKLSDAEILGDFHIFETNIPFLDTTMKNIELVFKDKIIEISSKGEVMGNIITFDGILKNKLYPPYKIEKAYLYTKNLDLNHIIEKLKVAEVDTISTFETFENFDLGSIIAKNFKLKADTIQLRNINASNFEATTSLSENKIFSVDNFEFNIAQGVLNGKYTYNLTNNDMGINLQAKSISANDITWALFDLNEQIYGDLTGNINLSCSGMDFNHCMETLSGNTTFKVTDGKMPKLGSLEYLLKAGNLVKGGITGLSINNVIDLLTPAKTGDFSDITGYARIKDGVARTIEITTQGEDLSLFIDGTYNFATSIADMEVLGLLSRNISTMLGPIGNLSINTLFNVIPGIDLTKESPVLERVNKIPGIELSSKAYRKFIAEIKGNINGDDYVTSFKWIN